MVTEIQAIKKVKCKIWKLRLSNQKRLMNTKLINEHKSLLVDPGPIQDSGPGNGSPCQI